MIKINDITTTMTPSHCQKLNFMPCSFTCRAQVGSRPASPLCRHAGTFAHRQPRHHRQQNDRPVHVRRRRDQRVIISRVERDHAMTIRRSLASSRATKTAGTAAAEIIIEVEWHEQRHGQGGDGNEAVAGELVCPAP